jgi:aminodeoxyfutalosine synthase
MMRDISLKIEQGQRINEQDALWLFQHAPLKELGRLANRVNLRKNGLAVFYNINRHINPTNICSLSCKFCAYSKKIGEEGSYAYEIDEMIAKAGEAVAQGATELHMVGGLHPRWNFQRYVDMIAAMHKAYPDVHLKAFTAVELDWMARKARKTIAEVMTELRAAGLGSFPGGGAEIFHPEIRDQICDTKVSGEQWVDTHRTAHNLGMRSNCTMLYGHIESFEHRVDHMRRLRELQDETKGFNVFIPLAFQPFQNEMGINRYTFGADDLRTIAVARLYLDNFRHIKSYWVMLGQDIAQLALQFGANDLDGTVLEEKISRAAGGRAGMIMTRSNLESLIRRSGRIPVERTTLYEPIHDHDRQHMSPVAEEACSESIMERLEALETGGSLAPSELWRVASEAPFHKVSAALDASGKLALAAHSVTESHVIELDNQSTPDSVHHLVRKLLLESTGADSNMRTLVIVLDTTFMTQAKDLTTITTACHQAAPESQIVLRGISAAKLSADKSCQKVTEHLANLRGSGLDILEESHTDQTMALEDKWQVMQSAKSADLATVPTLVLQSSGNAMNWSLWAEDVTNLRSRLSLDQTSFAVSFRVNRDAIIMPSEYLKALALTRLCLPNHIQIWTPADGVPALSPNQGIGADQNQKSLVKLISTLSAFGSAGLGFVSRRDLSVEQILEDIRASGVAPQLTCGRLNRQETPDAMTQRLEALRHVPDRIGVG